MITSNELTGKILKGIGGFYYVSTDRGVIECHARGNFRKKDLSPIVGDSITLTLLPDGTGSIVKIHPRKNFLIRPEVANIDVLVLVSAMRSPAPDFGLIDKLLVTAESKHIKGVICLNKTDLSDGNEIAEVSDIYKKAGYTVIVASAKPARERKNCRTL